MGVIDSATLQSEMLAYLRAGSFTYFETSDVAEYVPLLQIWVKAQPAAQCTARMVYNSADGKHHVEFPCWDEPAPSGFYAEMETIAAEWGLAVDRNTSPPV